MDYRQLLRIMLEDTSQEELAKELKTTQATVSRWLSGQEPRGGALERIRELAKKRRLAENTAIEQDFNHIPVSGLSGFDDSDIAMQGSISITCKGSAVPKQSLKKPTGDIINFTIHAGMGNSGTSSVVVNEDGLVNDPADSDGFWSFPDQVKTRWKHIKQTYAMLVTGDSMEPTLTNGSYVFIDTSHKYPSPPDLYAVNYGHGLMVKRLELLPENKIHIISDNERYSDFEFHLQDIEVYGKVAACFQWRG